MSLWDEFKSVASSGVHLGENILSAVGNTPGIKQVSEVDRWLYSNAIAQPISAAGLALNPAYGDQKGALGALTATSPLGYLGLKAATGQDPLASQGYQDSRTVSPGQSLTSLPLGSWDRVLHGDPFKAVDPTTKASQDYFKNSVAGKLQTGSVDAVINFYGDPLTAVGKVGAGVRTARVTREISGPGSMTTRQGAIDTANREITQHAAGKRTSLGVQLETAANTTDIATIRNMPFVANSSRPDLMADLMAHADTYEKAQLTFRAAIGDKSALEALATKDAFLEDVINAQALQRRGATIGPRGEVLHEWDQLTPAEKAAHGRLLEAWQQEREWTTKAVGSYDLEGVSRVGGIANTVDRLGPASVKGAERVMARAERKGRNQMTGTWNVEVLQKIPGSTPVLALTYKALHGERPSGWVKVDGDQAHRSGDEILAVLNSVKALKGPDFADYKSGVLAEWSNLPTSQARYEYLTKFEHDVTVKIAESHGVSADVATSLYESYNRARMSATEFAKSQGYLYENGGIIKSPVLVTQLANNVPMADFRMMDKLLSREAGFTKGHINLDHYLGKGASKRLGEAGDTMGAGLEAIINDLWKPAVLFRLGYPIRNAMDNAIRTWAYGGSAFEKLGDGVSNLLWRPVSYYNQKLLPGLDRTIVSHNGRLEQLRREADDLTPLLTDKNRAVRERARKDYVDNQADIESVKGALDETLSVRGQVEARAKVIRVGQKDIKVDYRGRTVIADGAFAGERGDIARLLSSGDESTQRMLNSPGRQLQADEFSSSFRTVTPTEPVYFDSLADVLNKQFRFDPVVSQWLKGSSVDDVADWLRSNAGRSYRREVGVAYDEIDDHVLRVLGATEQYLPDAGLRATLGERAVSASELSAGLRGNPNLSPIHGRGLANITGQDTLKTRWEATVKKVYRRIGTMPEDTLSRHPFYAQVYERELRAMVKDQIDQGVYDIGLKNLEDAAHATALRATQDTLYTIHRYSDAAATMRFVSPFFMAWENTVRTYAHLGVRDVSKAARASWAWNAPNYAGVVYDQDGNQITGGGGLTDNAYVVLQLGKLDGALGGLTRVALPKAGFNVALQGDPWYLPGFGPVVQIPANEILKRKPEYEAIIEKWVLPYGAENSSVKMLLPAWMKRLSTRVNEDSAEFLSSVNNIMASEKLKYDMGERDTPPTLKEATERAQSFYETRILANLTLPVSPTFSAPNQFYRDEYRRMRTQLGAEADRAFYEKYGDDLYQFASTSMSKNETGVDYGVTATRRARGNNGLIGEVASLDPGLVGLVTNPVAREDFSQSAYTFFLDKSVSPGSDLKYRTNYSPQEAEKNSEVRLGWIKYREAKTQLDAMMAERGLTSLSQTGAEDINAAWQKYKFEELGQITDPVTGEKRTSEWWYAYQQRDEGGWQKNIQGVELIAGNATFRAAAAKDTIESGAWNLVDTYLEARQDAMRMLADREAAGGSGSIQAKSNADIVTAWDTYVADLRSRNTHFADIYDRYLEGDKLELIPGE